jgi:hypothetical protein
MPEKRKRLDAAVLRKLDRLGLTLYPEMYIADIYSVYEVYGVSQTMRRRVNDVTRYMHELDDRTDAYAYFHGEYRLLQQTGAIDVLNRISFAASSTATLFFSEKQDPSHQDYMRVSRAIYAVVRDLIEVQNADKERQVKRISNIYRGCT